MTSEIEDIALFRVDKTHKTQDQGTRFYKRAYAQFMHIHIHAHTYAQCGTLTLRTI